MGATDAQSTKPRRPLTQAKPRPAADPSDNHSKCLIAAPRHSIPSLPLRDSYAATIMPLPRCRIPILTVAGLIEIGPLHRLQLTEFEAADGVLRSGPMRLFQRCVRPKSKGYLMRITFLAVALSCSCALLPAP